jgi:N-acetylglucosaminyldiphosphoundecaprenol N-acetyl-beta-D-mannosaminyltransferase
MEAQRNAPFRVVIEGAALALPDGAGLLWAARRLGRPLRERVPGSDTLPLLAGLAARRGYRVYFLGAAPGVAEKAAAALARACPGLRVAGAYAGSPAPAEEDDLVARVRAAAPDLLFVAYGAPQQDLWIHRKPGPPGRAVCMGVGGAFDFVAGVVPAGAAVDAPPQPGMALPPVPPTLALAPDGRVAAIRLVGLATGSRRPLLVIN